MHRLLQKLRRKRILLPGIALLAALFCWFLLPLFFPIPGSLTQDPAASPVLLDRHGRPLHRLVLPDYTRSAPVTLDQIPTDLIACTLAAEDKRFFTHGGIDLAAILRAARDAVLHRRATSGASTITQQLVKLSSPPAPRNLRTKFRETLTARRLEMAWPKEKILAAYFDRLPYGNHRTGPVEAARFYFQKPLADLSLAECALLAGLPQAPSRLDPCKHPARAERRRAIVLQRLAASGKYGSSHISAALREPLSLRPLREKSVAPWLPSQFDVQSSISDVRCSIDASLQHDLEAIVREEIAKLRDSNVGHAAVAVLHNPTREILALVSSGDWNDPRGGQINGALIPRSPGSALKPFTWLLAFEKGGLHPGSIVPDIPTRFRTLDGLDAPENYDRSFRGPVTVRQALACSLNVPAMRALNDLGGPKILHDFLLDLGLDTIGPDPAPYGLGLTLGNAPVRLLDLTNAYATLAEGGVHRPVRLWMGDGGWQMADVPASEPSAISHPPSPLSTHLIADILADAEARAPSFGRGVPLELPFRCAVKTGTSSDFRDNWCLGFTAEFTIGVWVGNFDNSPMKGVAGVAGAGPIFHRAMLRLHQQYIPSWPERPAGLVEVALDPLTGKTLAAPEVSRLHPSAFRISRSEFLPADRLPLPVSSADRDASGRVLLDSSYSEWFASEHNRRRHELTLAPSLPAENPLRILAPRDGAIYLLDPELPNGGLLHLATNLPGQAQWASGTLELRPGHPEPVARLVPGEHTLTATDPRGGAKREVRITVEER